MGLRLAAGLGNPGYEYRDSYHNVGYQAIDSLIRDHSYSKTTRRPGTIYEGENGPLDYLGKPDCYVNQSGGVLKQWVDALDLSPDSLLVIYDDFSLDVGDIRIRPSGSAGGHNGMKSIIEALQTKTIPRIRIGIGPLPDGVDPAEFVLSPIQDTEQTTYQRIYQALPEILRVLAEDGFNRAMDRWNGESFADGD
ncbi:MAG: aminoacyl-tRNA hydrolase [bacterium]